MENRILLHSKTDCERLKAVAACVRRRIILNRILSETTLAVAVALVGPAISFLATGHLSYFPILLPAALLGLGIGAWRLRRRIPDLYQASQALDLRLGSADQVSTAIHFLGSEAPEAVWQRLASVSITRNLNPRKYFPLTLPRSIWGLGSMVLVLSAIYGIGFLGSERILGQRPLPHTMLQSMMSAEDAALEEADRSEASLNEPAQNELFPIGDSPLDDGAMPQAGNADALAEGGGYSDSIEPAQDDDESDGAAAPDDPDMGSDYRDMIDENSPGAPMPSNGAIPPNARPSGSNPTSQRQADSGDSQRPDGSNDSSRDLLGRLRDAVNNLLSRFQPKQSRTASRRPSTPAQAESGQPGSEEQTSEMADAQDGTQQLAHAEGTQNGREIVGSESPGRREKSADETAQSAAGKQEGDKAIAEARRLTVMGKLSELYGQRAAQITGAIMIETATDERNESLSSASDAQATQPGAGGAASRDEIPLAYQDYVKDYFDKLRGMDKLHAGK